jgi:hypothetical protein
MAKMVAWDELIFSSKGIGGRHNTQQNEIQHNDTQLQNKIQHFIGKMRHSA